MPSCQPPPAAILFYYIEFVFEIYKIIMSEKKYNILNFKYLYSIYSNLKFYFKIFVIMFRVCLFLPKVKKDEVVSAVNIYFCCFVL